MYFTTKVAKNRGNVAVIFCYYNGITKRYKRRLETMANNKNLIPFTERTENEQRKIAKMGGIKSGEKRRERKQLKEELLLLLETNNNQEQISIALIEKAKTGDVRAFEMIRDTIGEKPLDKQEIKNTTPIIIVDNIEHKQMLEEL